MWRITELNKCATYHMNYGDHEELDFLAKNYHLKTCLTILPHNNPFMASLLYWSGISSVYRMWPKLLL